MLTLRADLHLHPTNINEVDLQLHEGPGRRFATLELGNLKIFVHTGADVEKLVGLLRVASRWVNPEVPQ